MIDRVNVRLTRRESHALQSALLVAIDNAKENRDGCADGSPAYLEWASIRDTLATVYERTVTAHYKACATPANVGKHWTPTDDAALRACYGPARRRTGSSDDAIEALADMLQRYPAAIVARLCKLDIWHG